MLYNFTHLHNGFCCIVDFGAGNMQVAWGYTGRKHSRRASSM